MYNLQLIKGRSYKSEIVIASRKNPEVTVNDLDVARDLVNSGHFMLINQNDIFENKVIDDCVYANGFENKIDDEEINSNSENESYPVLENMNISELKAYAAEKGIKLNSAAKKDEILAILIEAEIAEENKIAEENVLKLNDLD